MKIDIGLIFIGSFLLSVGLIGLWASDVIVFIGSLAMVCCSSFAFLQAVDTEDNRKEEK